MVRVLLAGLTLGVAVTVGTSRAWGIDDLISGTPMEIEWGCSYSRGPRAEPLGDVDGDGADDIGFFVCGAGDAWGVAYGRPFDGLSVSPDWTWPGLHSSWEASGMGDVNGDGFDDLVLVEAAFQWDHTADVLPFWGGPAGLGEAPAKSLYLWLSTSWYGLSLPDPIAAGDLNGDGFSDLHLRESGDSWVHLGEPLGFSAPPLAFIDDLGDSWSCGSSVMQGADMDGDGTAELVLGHESPIQVDSCARGAVLLYRGAQLGLGTGPDWVDCAVADGPDTSCQEYVAGGLRYLLSPVSGDANGDGLADLLIGDPGSYGNPEADGGEATLRLGCLGGPPSVPVWGRSSASPEHDFSGDLTFVGDLNGDGYDEIALGFNGPLWGDQPEFRHIEVFLGSPAGPHPEPAWEISDPDGAWYQVGCWFGPAGDFDGDGYDDLIIGGRWLFQGCPDSDGDGVRNCTPPGLVPPELPPDLCTEVWPEDDDATPDDDDSAAGDDDSVVQDDDSGDDDSSMGDDDSATGDDDSAEPATDCGCTSPGCSGDAAAGAALPLLLGAPMLRRRSRRV